GELSQIAPETVEKLNAILPAAWSHGNPIDILGDAGPDRYAEALKIAADDPNSNGLLVILTPQAMTDPTATAEKLTNYGNIRGNPVLASWRGGKEVEEGERILSRANIPALPYPDTAVRLFNYMWQYAENLRAIYETPMLPAAKDDEPSRRSDA